MSWRFCLILFIGVLLEWKLTLSAPAETGKTKEAKGRAYEFGFTIEEQQHRHEKRDENGIVMGEFGFITADGIYHVTVYATDENGKFKIISMKSYPYENPEKKVMIASIPLSPAVKPTTMVKANKPDGKSCGGCVLPKKSNLLPADVKGKKPDDEKAVFRPLAKELSNGKTNGGASASGKSTPTKQSNPSKTTGTNAKGTSASQKPLPQLPGARVSPKTSGTNGAKTPTTNTQSTNKQTPSTPSLKPVGKTNPSNNIGGGVGTKPGSGGAVGGATSNSGKSIGGVGGGGDGGGPLYRFKYVLDYNSHREEGRIDGSKKGNYNTLDEDGIRRIIDYIANENGYQPYVKVERLPPNELPTGENKLKEYEFVWFNKT